MRETRHQYLGTIPYREAASLQERTARAVKDGRGPERLYLLEHPPVITLGRNASEADVLHPPRVLRERGIAVETSDRGGRVTYHGPGQLVGYPILNLHPDRRDVARYLRDLEEVIIRTLGTLGIAARRRAGLTGVWVGNEKIAAIGVHLSRWVTTHGFALNVTTDLSHFAGIVPCGLRGLGVTSIQRLAGGGPGVRDVARALVPIFGAVFSRMMVEEPRPAPALAAAGGA